MALNRQPRLKAYSTSDTISAGKVYIEIQNVGSAAGVVDGASLPAGKTVSWTAPGGDELGEVTFDGTGTTLLVTTLS
tara:strand:- start:1293 stop:1523 length:231 start_codon:yes stop_codon:yes gene_type:complete